MAEFGKPIEHILSYLCSSWRLSDAKRYIKVIEREVPPPTSQKAGPAQTNLSGNMPGKETGVSQSERILIDTQISGQEFTDLRRLSKGKTTAVRPRPAL